MEEFVETTESMHPSGGTWFIYVMEEAKKLGLGPEDEIGAVLFRPEDMDHVKSLLYGTGAYMFFIAVGTEGGEPFYDVRKSLSERTLAHSLDYEPVTILGPFERLSDCLRFRDILEERNETDPAALKRLFRESLDG